MLTEKQRELLFEKYIRRRADGKTQSQKEFASWAKKGFNPSVDPNQATVSRIIQSLSAKKFSNRVDIFKRDRTEANRKLENALYG